MKQICYSNPKSVITVIIIINNIQLWNYIYRDNIIFENSNKLQKPCEHELGIANDLDVHYWEIHLGNMTDKDIKAIVKIKWFEDGKEIAQWIPDEAFLGGKVIVNANSEMEITDSAIFVKC
jgi:hypothetical protein